MENRSGSRLYFIAIEPDESVINDIRSFQRYMSDHFSSSRQLGIPVHITLIPPFRMDPAKENDFVKLLARSVEDKPGFKMVCNDFDHFRFRVLFVATQSNLILNELQQVLRINVNKWLGTDQEPHEHTFTPHITIANKDLTPDNFKGAWSKFKNRYYRKAFNVDNVVLYKHDEGSWELCEKIQLNIAH